MNHQRIRTSQPVQERARELRKEMTPAESKLWNALRNRQLGDIKFRRQHPIGSFIVDFYCAEYRLVIEIDGPIHQFQIESDAERSSILTEHGDRVIRFTNEMVENDLETVLKEISRCCGRNWIDE